MSQSASSKTVVAQLVEAMRALAGSHPGFRPAHAKGIVCSGTFRGAAEARGVSRAAHLQGQPVPVVIRFANSSGDPEVHDGLPSVRSMAVKFDLPGRKHADILANTIEGFVARTPEEFLAFLQAQLPDPATGKPDPGAVPRFIASHPAAGGFIGRLQQRPVPASYGQSNYFAEHAFRFIAADGSSRFGRYRFEPDACEAYLSPDDGGKRGANFLREELEARLKKGPVAFRLRLQLAGANDPTDDVTALWPADRQIVELGRLEVTSISPTSEADERRMVFDPTNLTDGIELSGDPIPAARSAAYSISYDQRSKGQ